MNNFEEQDNPASVLVPMVVKKTQDGERGYDIFSRLLDDRIIFLAGPIDDAVASVVCAQLLMLESENSSRQIYLYINSPGGYVTSGMAIYDTMQFIKPKIHTTCMGQACSMGSLLLAAGSEGCRVALPNSRIMVHQPSAGYKGTTEDIRLHAQEIIKSKQRLNEIYVKHTGQKLKAIEEALDRDNFMTAEEAKKFGLVDKIIDKRLDFDDDE